MRACQAKVATVAEIKAPDALREAALDARPERILGFKLRRLLALSCGLHRFVVGLGSDRELPRGIFRRRAHLTGGTGATGGPVKTDPKHRIAGDIVAWGPFDTRMPLGTAGLVGVPIQDESLQVIAVTACNRNWPGLQSACFWDHINCLYRHGQGHINCH